jgi:hypothetical protein
VFFFLGPLHQMSLKGCPQKVPKLHFLSSYLSLSKHIQVIVNVQIFSTTGSTPCREGA